MANDFRTIDEDDTDTAVGLGDGPVVPGPAAVATLRPLPLADARIDGGQWAERQRVNRDATLPRGWHNLQDAGNLENFRHAAAHDGPDPDKFQNKWFADSDLAKWLEAAAWESARRPSAQLAEWSEGAAELIAAAQLPDGYLNTYVQLVQGDDRRWADLSWSHELYCLGHLVQAAVARTRATGRTDLLDVAVRAAELLGRTFGHDRLDTVDGHPEIETALVELARLTGRADILGTAAYFVDAHGRNRTDPSGERSAYFADLIPPREATTVYGHAVRMLYLQCGVVDVAVETGDRDLLDASIAAWESMVREKSYLTGGVGSRWEGESFGAPFELGPDRAYCETCAAQAVIQWSWRLLLATGDERYADHLERTLYNGFAAGTSSDGLSFFYVNTLQLRGGTISENERDPANGRRGWFSCACCPPSVMRLTSSLAAYLATADDTGLQLHQYATGRLAAELPSGRLAVTVTTDYPAAGHVIVHIDEAPDTVATLALRIPAWCTDASVSTGHSSTAPEPGGRTTITGRFAPGDVVELDLAMPPRLVAADDRVDAIRGQVALTRGPLVYCFEQADAEPGTSVDDLRLVPALEPGTDLADPGPSAGPGGGVVVDAVVRNDPDLLGGTVTIDVPARSSDGRAVVARAVPYALWANRELGPMRIWTPVS